MLESLHLRTAGGGCSRGRSRQLPDRQPRDRVIHWRAGASGRVAGARITASSIASYVGWVIRSRMVTVGCTHCVGRCPSRRDRRDNGAVCVAALSAPLATAVTAATRAHRRLPSAERYGHVSVSASAGQWRGVLGDPGRRHRISQEPRKARGRGPVRRLRRPRLERASTHQHARRTQAGRSVLQCVYLRT